MSTADVATAKVYDLLRSAILTGEYEPSTRLTADAIAQKHGVSRTPVRDVLWRLHAEGLVEMIANQGAYVANPSAGEIIEIYGLRAVMESHAASLAAARMTLTHLEELRRCADVMEGAVEGSAEDRLTVLAVENDKFHKIITRASGNRRLAALIASLTEIPSALKTLTAFSMQQLRRSQMHHYDLVSAFSERDAAWARATMEAHILAARASYVTETERQSQRS